MIEFNPPEKSYKGYIFDCDGTLADTMPLHLEAWNAGLVKAKSPYQLDGKSFMSVAGMALRQTVLHLNKLHAANVDPDVVMEVKNTYFASHQAEVIAIPAVEKFARECATREDAKISVASGGSAEDVSKTLEVIGMKDLFQIVVTADDVEHSKPAPDLFLLAAKRMGIDPRDCLVIEDSLLGVEAAEKAGMDSVLVPHRF